MSKDDDIPKDWIPPGATRIRKPEEPKPDVLSSLRAYLGEVPAPNPSDPKEEEYKELAVSINTIVNGTLREMEQTTATLSPIVPLTWEEKTGRFQLERLYFNLGEDPLKVSPGLGTKICTLSRDLMPTTFYPLYLKAKETLEEFFRQKGVSGRAREANYLGQAYLRHQGSEQPYAVVRGAVWEAYDVSSKIVAPYGCSLAVISLGAEREKRKAEVAFSQLLVIPHKMTNPRIERADIFFKIPDQTKIEQVKVYKR